MKQNIPAGSDVVFYGHSLGGMIAQEAAADKTIKRMYNVTNTVTFGSPLIKLLSRREGLVRRMCDTSDICSCIKRIFTDTSCSNSVLGKRTFLEDGGYNSKWLAAHNESYLRQDVWGGYDVLGIKGGNATMTFDMGAAAYYEAPGISWLHLKK